jgi:hydroxymethylbilane synthase
VIEPIRGNIDTRMRKLKEESFSAIILAAAGLERMQWNGNITEFLPVDISLPAVGQGALAIECRENDAELLALLDKLNDKDTALAVKAERAFLRTLEGGCQVPIAAYANVADDRVSLTGLVAEPDGGTILKEKMESEDPEALGVNLAYKLKEQGADEILEKVYKDNQA